MSIILHHINLGPVFTASGTRNFFGQGWSYHKYYRLIPGFDFSGSTLITKTTTRDFRQGNMPLDKQQQPIELRPKCIYINFRKGLVLNAVGLSGPGAISLIRSDVWQRLAQPFFISFMAVGNSQEERYLELADFCQLLQAYSFKSKFGLEINISCPNTQHQTDKLITEATDLILIAKSRLADVQIILKINALIHPKIIKQIIEETNCDALDVSNTIPWGQLPDQINWSKIAPVSPLQKFGGGGLSGKPLLPIVTDWIKRPGAVELPYQLLVVAYFVKKMFYLTLKPGLMQFQSAP